MEKIFALIKNGKVAASIMADDKFIESIRERWEACVRIDELAMRPGKDWTYDGANFAPPVIPESVPKEKPVEKPLQELRELTKAFSADQKMKQFADKLIEVIEVSAETKLRSGVNK